MEILSSWKEKKADVNLTCVENSGRPVESRLEDPGEVSRHSLAPTGDYLRVPSFDILGLDLTPGCAPPTNGISGIHATALRSSGSNVSGAQVEPKMTFEL